MLILSLLLTQNQKYLLGSSSDGDLFVWVFEEILSEYLKQSSEENNIFTSICNFKLKEGKIFNLKIEENNLDRLFFHDDYFLYAYRWSDFLNEIQERKLVGFPAAKVTSLSEKFISKLNINLEFGEAINKITSADYDLIGKRCFLGTDKGNILTVDLDGFTILKLITPFKNTLGLEGNLFAINGLKFYTENFVVFGNEKGQIHLWDYEHNKEVKRYKLEKESLGPVTCIQLDKDGRWVTVGHHDYITRWHLESTTLASAMPIVGEVTSLLSGSMTIVSSHNGKGIYQWTEAGELQTKAEASVSSVTTIIGEVDTKDKVVISGGTGHLVDVFLNSSRVISFLA